MIFTELNKAEDFFNILPDDWRNELKSTWDQINLKSQIYCLIDDNKIVAGGIVLETCPTDLLSIKDKFHCYLQNNYLYIGYLWVIPNQRGKDLGTTWLSHVKTIQDQSRLWLTIEDKNLKSFYEKNGFKLVESYQIQNKTEWLLVYDESET